MTTDTADQLNAADPRNASPARLAVLERRARELARSKATADLPGLALELVEFEVQSERYALETEAVREIILPGHICSIPHTPDFVLGVINLRGLILSVLDPAVLLGIPRQELPERPPVAVLADRDMTFGLAMDRVLGVRTVLRDTIQTELAGGSQQVCRYALGITPERLTILRADAILNDPSLIVDTPL